MADELLQITTGGQPCLKKPKDWYWDQSPYYGVEFVMNLDLFGTKLPNCLFALSCPLDHLSLRLLGLTIKHKKHWKKQQQQQQ